jgi:hypothetical protein
LGRGGCDRGRRWSAVGQAFDAAFDLTWSTERRFVARTLYMTASFPRIVAATLLAAVLGTLISRVALAQNDIVFFKNGERLTGEVKGLDRSKISFDTSATGVINLEWDDIGQLYSMVTFKLALNTGEELYGTLAESTTPAEIRLQTTTETRDLAILTIVRMAPIQSKVIERIEMSVNAGYSVAKANDLEQKAFGYDFEYRDQRRHVTFNIDSSLSNSEHDPSSQRAFANFAYRRFRPSGVWDPFGIGQVERNDEVSVDLRQTFGAGMTRTFRSNAMLPPSRPQAGPPASVLRE